jgi:small subunit ribosomal protein S16
MLTIRLTRKGKKNQPFFRVVLIDKRRSTKGGRSVEDLGYVDPLKKRKSFNKERILYWISKGAQTSDTIHNLLVSEKIIDAKKIHVSKLSKKKLIEMNAKKAEISGSTMPTEIVPEEIPAEPAESPSDNQAGREPEASKDEEKTAE